MEPRFSSSDLTNLQIEQFVFHIIIKDKDIPRYLDNVQLTQTQLEFFKEQFCLAAKISHEYEFIDRETSSTYQMINELVNSPIEKFIPISKKLTGSFHSQHRGNVNDGIFIIALVRLPETGRLLFLIKMDHEKVLDFELRDIDHNVTTAILRKVINPIVQSKEAIQKVAIIDVSERYPWDILANDRATGSRPEVSNYFASFLQMKPMETEEKLMNKTVDAAREWARINKAELQQLPGKIKEKAVTFMEHRPVFEAESFAEEILAEEPDERQERLKVSLVNFLDQEGIANRSFSPNYDGLYNKPSKLITGEDVELRWKGSMENNFIEIKKPEETGDGLFHILIKTQKVDFKK
jgi:hypothetical protein